MKSIMKNTFLPVVLAGIACSMLKPDAALAAGGLAELDAYNTVFDSPSQDEADSIPLGNGTTGLNLWVEENGDLLFYLSRNDALSEMHRLMKLGRIRISIAPNPFAAGKPFRQELCLRNGCCDIVAGAKGEEVRLKVFVDSDGQTVYVSGTSEQPVSVSATLENWRQQAKQLDTASGEIGSTWIYRGGIGPKSLGVKNEESADVVLKKPEAVTWYHRNEHSPVAVHIQQQHLTDFASEIHDPILHRSFGATLFGPGFVSGAAGVLALKKPGKTFDVRVTTHSAQTESADRFLKQLEEHMRGSVSPVAAADRTSRWWQSFWSRSWVFVEETRIPALDTNANLLRFGADSSGGNVLRGGFGRLAVYDRALSPDEIGQLSKTAPEQKTPIASALADNATGFSAQGAVDLARGELTGGYLEARDSASWELPRGLTLEAWIKPAASGRCIFDKKITKHGANGFLFDSYGGKLRFIIANQTFAGKTTLPTQQWIHAAVTIDNASGAIALYLNGEREGGNALGSGEETRSMITQAYVLIRYQLACQERSSFPAHFNGGIFTVAPEFAFYSIDPRGKNWSADYRFYGCNLWWQNTRFLYQLHLAQGNYDLMDSFYDFYFRHQPTFRGMAKRYYDADGIYMNEVLSLFGLPGMGDFGWGAKEYSESYTQNIWQQALEFGAMALDRYDYTGDEVFLKKAIAWCDDALKFYDTRFKKDAQEKIVIAPSHGLETYWRGVTNDMPSVAGLHEITRRLLALPKQTTHEQRARWQSIAKAIPELPKTTNTLGLIIPDVAHKYKPNRANFEAPDLYCVYPFRLYGIGRTEHDIEEARRAWADMVVPHHYCWYQTGILAARLGLDEGASKDLRVRSGPRTSLKVAGGKGRTFRFPGFYGSPHDWPPDYDGAGNMANTLQEMLLQPGPNQQLLLLPAWPKGWDASFKLHAPGKTTIECVYRQGIIQKLEVLPKERAKDVVLPPFLAVGSNKPAPSL
jgi:hypothetical protein